MINLLLAGLALCTGTGDFPGDPGGFAAHWGPSDVTAISGNGALTVGVNPFGRLSSCRWPSPGYCDQLSYSVIDPLMPDRGVKPNHGAMGAIMIDDKMYWLTGAPWQVQSQEYADEESTIVKTKMTLERLDAESTPVEVIQTHFVHPELDLLVVQMQVRNLETLPRLFWYQNFTPCTHVLPELPLKDWALDFLNDFAVFSSNDRLYHFRPSEPGQDDWRRAMHLAAKGAMPVAWSVFDKDESNGSVWIGTASPNHIVSSHCGVDGMPDSAFAKVDAGGLSDMSAAVGQCNAALELVPARRRGAFRGTVYIAFGRDRADISATLDTALERGYSRLYGETQSHWKQWLEAAGLSLRDNANETIRRRALLTMAQAMDRQTGAIVRAPITQPPLALDWARNGAWINLALDTAGYHGLATRHSKFYLSALRKKRSPGAPRGSLPAASYSNGESALPNAVLDVEAVAWMLSGYWRHTLFLEASQRKGFLDSVWPGVEPATEFLASWTRGNNGAPFPSFQQDRLHDGDSDMLLLTTYMGLTSVSRMAEELGRPMNALGKTRLAEIESQLMFQLVQETALWSIPRTFPYWLEGIIEPSHRLWEEGFARHGETRQPLGEVDFPVEEILGVDRKRWPFPDALESAMRFLAATMQLYSEEPENTIIPASP
jgi:hypothetical protein